MSNWNYQLFVPNDIRIVKEPNTRKYQFKGGPYDRQNGSLRLCGECTFTFTAAGFTGRYRKAGEMLKWEPRYVDGFEYI